MKGVMNGQTYFSAGKSILSPEKLVELAVEAGAEVVALTDYMNINALAKFVKACDKAEVKYIIGCTLHVVEDATGRPEKDGPKYRPEFCWPRVYVKNEQGYRDLLKLLTLANTEEYFYKQARLSWKDVVAAVNKGNLFISTGTDYSVYGKQNTADIPYKNWLLENSAMDEPAYQRLQDFVEEAYLDGEYHFVSLPTRCEKTEDIKALDVMRSITTPGSKYGDSWLPMAQGDYSGVMPSYLLEPLADKVNQISYKWKEKPISLPKMAEDEVATLTQMCLDGLDKKIKKPFLKYRIPESDLPKYHERLKYELEIIISKGFCGYFLLCEDIVSFALSAGIKVGYGRGSVGGSLVSYCLNISSIDPIRFDTMFERFMNPDRQDYPDIDIDFQSSRRTEVLDYIVERYGEENCAAISNYTMLGAKSAIREVSRVSGLNELEYACSKQVPDEHGESYNLEDAAKEVPDIAKFSKKHPEIWQVAVALEGCLKSYSQHAAGFVVSGEPLIERAVVQTRGNTGYPSVALDKRSVESEGLVKMDILAVAQLDVEAFAIDMIEEATGVIVDTDDISLKDEKTLDMLSRADTTGVFQLGGGGAKKILKDIGQAPDFSIDDVIATNALNRPGPIDSGLTDDYIKIRLGEEYPTYDHDDLIPVLSKSHSVPIYQESVMAMTQVLAGFTGAEADTVRSAIGKKDPEKLKAMNTRFIEGAAETGKISDYKAKALWEKFEKYGAYSFNLSHSVGYSLASFAMAYIKAHYPEQFYAASLSVQEKDNALNQLVRDMESRGIKLMPPMINVSKGDYFNTEGGKIYTPFKSVLYLTARTGIEIEKTLELGPVSTVEQFETQKEEAGAKVNKRQVGNLEAVGAFSEDSSDEQFLIAQKELLRGLSTGNVVSERVIEWTTKSKAEMRRVLLDIPMCKECSLRDSAHMMPTVGKAPKVFVVMEVPSKADAKAGRIGSGSALQYLNIALENAGLSVNDIYLTSLVKAPKEKQLTNSQITACQKHLEKEVALLNPPVIVALGRNVINRFIPGMKGSVESLVGTCHYEPESKRSIILGETPGTIFFNPDKQNGLDEVMDIARSILKPTGE